MKRIHKILAVSFVAMIALSFTGCFNKPKVENNLVELKNYYPYVAVVAEGEIIAPEYLAKLKANAEDNLKRKEAGAKWYGGTDINRFLSAAQEGKNDILGTLSNFDGLKIVDRSSLDKIKAEIKFQNSDWSNENKTVALGKALNANIIITINAIDNLDSNIAHFSVKFLDINTLVSSTYIAEYNAWDRHFKIKGVDLSRFSKANTRSNPFVETLSMKAKDMERSAVKFERKANAVLACPFGATPNIPVTAKQIKKLPKNQQKIAQIKTMNFDLYEVEVTFHDGSSDFYEFTFHPLEEPYIVQKKKINYTDGKIGTIEIPGLIDECGVYQNTRNELVLLPYSTLGDGYGTCYWLPLRKN